MTPTTVAPPPVGKSVASSLGINYPPLHSQAAERPSLPLGRLVGITVVKQANSRESRESEGCTRAGAAAGHFLRSSFWAEKRPFRAIFREIHRVSLHGRLHGGEGGIRTLDTGVSPYNGLANRRLQPLGHLSGACRTSAAIVYHRSLPSKSATQAASFPPAAPHRSSNLCDIIARVNLSARHSAVAPIALC
jgi:hypothetical protein